MVLVSLSIKTCDFPSFFFTASVSELHQSRVNGASEKQKKKKKKETLLEHRSPANRTGSGVRYVSVQPSQNLLLSFHAESQEGK